MNPIFPKTFLLLQQEGHLVQSTLLSGLNHLRRARLDRRGEFFSAFFQLSTGLERLMKCIFVMESMRSNNLIPPKDKELKHFGHDLLTLFSKLANSQISGGTNPLSKIHDGSIEQDILSHLSDFAEGSRYHNLDSLVSESTSVDPLESWTRIVERIIESDLTSKMKSKIRSQSQIYGDLLNDCSFTIATNMNSELIGLMESVKVAKFHEAASGFAVWHTMNIIGALSKRCGDLSSEMFHTGTRNTNSPVPYMSEFFDFTLHEKKVVVRKKCWP